MRPRTPDIDHRSPPSRSALYAPADTGPRYPIRATRLRPEEQAEFGVGTAHELVALLNRAWSRTGLRPLAPGSFPTSRVKLRFVLREARLAMAEGHLEPPAAPAAQ